MKPKNLQTLCFLSEVSLHLDCLLSSGKIAYDESRSKPLDFTICFCHNLLALTCFR